MSVLEVIGWLLIVASAGSAIQMWWYDRRLQERRVTKQAASAYALVPLRWRKVLYTQEAQPLVHRARRAMWVMYGFAFLGMLFLAAGAR